MPVMAAPAPAPWMPATGVYGWAHTSNGVKPTLKFIAMLSGGSLPSTSVTLDARIVSVQASPFVKSIPGSRTNAVGPPATDADTLPLAEHTSVNQAPATLTGSLNVTERFAFTGKSV